MSFQKTAKVIEVESAFNGLIEDLLKEWREERLSHRDIAAKVSSKGARVSHVTVGSWLNKMGLDTKKVISEGGKTKKMRALERFLGCEDIRKESQRLYYQENLSFLKISVMSNGLVTKDNISRWFQRWGLPARSPFQGMAEKQRELWQQRRKVLRDCQQRMNQNPSSQLTITPKEENVLVGLAKSRHKQARQLLICANLHHIDVLAQKYLIKLPGWATEYFAGELMSAGYVKITEVVNGIGSFKQGSRFSTFAYAAIRNAMVDVIRRSVVREKHEELAGVRGTCVNWPLDGEKIIEQIFSEEAAALVAEAVNKLPPEKKYLLLSRAIDESTFVEIADELGLSYEAARSAYRRLKAKLKNDPNIKKLKDLVLTGC